MNSHKYCLELVKTHDYHNFITTLFIKDPAIRKSIFALRAFNIETAIIQDSVKTTDTAMMRIEWWKLAIDDALKLKPVQHPVLLELSNTTERSQLSKIWFTRILNQRLDLLNRSSFPSMDSLEMYADQTASSLLYLQLEAIGVKNLNIEHASGHLGKAIGITTLLRGLPYTLANDRILLPSSVMAKVLFL